MMNNLESVKIMDGERYCLISENSAQGVYQPCPYQASFLNSFSILGIIGFVGVGLILLPKIQERKESFEKAISQASQSLRGV